MSELQRLETLRRRSRRLRICGDYGHRANHPGGGGPCMRKVKDGTTGCHWHVDEVATLVPEYAQISEQIEREWGLPVGVVEPEVADPAAIMLALITQSARRVAYYSAELGRLSMQAEFLKLPTREEMVLGSMSAFAPDDGYGPADDAEPANEEPGLAAVLAPDYAVTPAGDRVKVGQKVRALVELEAKERRDLRQACKEALGLGIEARRVRAAEDQGTNLAAVVKEMAARLGLSPAQMAQLPDALAAAVAQVFASGEPVLEGEIV